MTIWIVFKLKEDGCLGFGIGEDFPEIIKAFPTEEQAKEYMCNCIEGSEVEENGIYAGKNDDDWDYYYKRCELDLGGRA